MSSSPYLTYELKEYLNEHKIEQTLNATINNLLKERSEDPYSFMISSFEEKCSSNIKLIKIKAYENFNSENMPSIGLIFHIYFRLKNYSIVSPVSFSLSTENQNNILYDVENMDRFIGKGMIKASEMINCLVNEKLSNQTCQNQKKIDDLLTSLLESDNNIINVIWPISFSFPNIVSKTLNIPLYQHIMINMDIIKREKTKNPPLIINLLQGSKLVNSKCKINKFQLWLENNNKSASETISIAQKIIGNIRKAIVSTKAGESALKFHSDGSFICPFDSIIDNLKIIEEAINSSGFKEDAKIGLCVQADNFYLLDQKKYELENPKKPEDIDQIIDYFFKLCDRGLIGYLEDPIYSEDLEGWRKLFNKFKDSKIKIGSRKLYSNINKAKTICEINKDPNLNEAENLKIEQNLINLHYAFYKLGDFNTFSDLISMHKFLNTKKNKTKMILCENITEGIDTTVVDLCYSLDETLLCLNPILKYERTIKYNRYIEIDMFSQ